VNHEPASVERYLEHLRCGRGEVEDALHSLAEADLRVLRALMAAVAKPENHAIRHQIVHCIWQQRNPASLAFLSQLLRDPDENVWKEALDGLVAIGGSTSRDLLTSAKESIADPTRREWIEEAVGQIVVE
jgi:HEAT repeat protein